jgi:hypothetical protein
MTTAVYTALCFLRGRCYERLLSSPLPECMSRMGLVNRSRYGKVVQLGRGPGPTLWCSEVFCERNR